VVTKLSTCATRATAPYGILILTTFGLLPVVLVLAAIGSQIYWISLAVELRRLLAGSVQPIRESAQPVFDETQPTVRLVRLYRVANWPLTCISSRGIELMRRQYMKRLIAGFAVTVGCSLAIASARRTQRRRPRRRSTAQGADHYLHGLRAGRNGNAKLRPRQVVPVGRSTETTVGTSGTTTTTTTTKYALVPDEKVEIQTHVGHKVEVTGVMIPAGDSKSTTTTKIEREDAPDSKTKETVKTDNALPQFRVTSI